MTINLATQPEQPVPNGVTSDISESGELEVVPLDDDEEELPQNTKEAVATSDDKEPPQDSSTGRIGRRSKPKPTCGRDLGVWDSSLEDRANCVSHWTLSYLTPLLKLGASKVLDPDDVGVPSECDRAAGAYDAALTAWETQEQKCAVINEQRTKEYEAKLDKCTTDEQRKKVKPVKMKEPSIALALLKSFGVCKVVYAITLYVISAFLTFVPVLILNDLVGFFESEQTLNNYTTFVHPWAEVVGLAVLPVVISELQTRHSVIMAHCAVYVRTAVSMLLYRKSLNISAAGRAKTSTGQVVNMMSNDTAQLQRFLQFAGMIFTAPLQIILSLILIFQQVGNATWVGVGFMVLLAPVNVVVFSVVSKMRRRVLKFSDLRVKMINEILNGIRIIKFYAWERPFAKEVNKLREEELEALTKLAYVSAVGFSLILLSAPIIQPILVFLTYVNIQDQPLDAATAFTTVALFNIMRFPFAFMPMGLLQYIQSRISLNRLERYLQLPELAAYVSSTPPDGAKGDMAEEGSITIKDGTFAWVDPDAPPIRPVQEESKKKTKRRRSTPSNGDDSSSLDSSMRSSIHSTTTTGSAESGRRAPVITLKDISFSIAPGSLVAIVGPVGSGKSSLLSAVLGEMETINNSKVYMPRTDPSKDKAGFVSYCAQNPWVVNDTLRGNILFGREYDEARYSRVVEVCALQDDLAVLPAGDSTEIGERGINLSGGQKARVALARALYAESTKLLLFDDPLSAVDAHVGEHLFARAIAGKINEGTTRLLVTHHVHFLPRCDKVIVMHHGRIKHQGTYEELIAEGVDFAGAVDVSKVENNEVKESLTSSTSSAVDVIDVDDAKDDLPIERRNCLAREKKQAELMRKEKS